MRRFAGLARFVLVGLVVGGLAACSAPQRASGDDGGPPVDSGLPSDVGGPPPGDAGPQTILVVGVQSDDLMGYAQMMHVVAKVNGQNSFDETILPPDGSSDPFPGHWDRKVVAPVGEENGTVDVTVGVFDGPTNTSSETIKRTAQTQLVLGQEKLLRVHLEVRCMMYPFPDGPTEAGAPGPLQGISCTDPMTCIQGVCASDAVDPSQLEDYTADWWLHPPENCLTDNTGPMVIPGIGKTDFAPVTPGQTASVFLDAEGGHHIWIAVRQKNLTQWGSTLTVSAVQPSTSVMIPPMVYKYTFDPDTGGYCKLFGVDYQLDNTGINYMQFLGKPLNVTYSVTDAKGATASATASVTIASTVSP